MSGHPTRRSQSSRLLPLGVPEGQGICYKAKDNRRTHKKIQEEMRSISRTTCKSVMQNFVLRLEKCENLNGYHLEHVL